ncbi:hypothetical protein SEVIR_7G206300v4 [Setaria viridis]
MPLWEAFTASAAAPVAALLREASRVPPPRRGPVRPTERLRRRGGRAAAQRRGVRPALHRRVVHRRADGRWERARAGARARVPPPRRIRDGGVLGVRHQTGEGGGRDRFTSRLARQLVPRARGRVHRFSRRANGDRRQEVVRHRPVEPPARRERARAQQQKAPRMPRLARRTATSIRALRVVRLDVLAAKGANRGARRGVARQPPAVHLGAARCRPRQHIRGQRRDPAREAACRVHQADRWEGPGGHRLGAAAGDPGAPCHGGLHESLWLELNHGEHELREAHPGVAHALRPAMGRGACVRVPRRRISGEAVREANQGDTGGNHTAGDREDDGL